MKKLIVICLICLTSSGCAPFNVKIALYESNDYIFAEPQSSSNSVCVVSGNEPSRSYGNNNRVLVQQSNVMYKSPLTNSSNSVPIEIPLLK